MSRPTFFKHDMTPLAHERRTRKAGQKGAEKAAMDKVRKRDKGCRFPLCRCRRVGIRLEVSHDLHRGMGGNPAGDRTDPATMVQVCAWRHTQGIFALDKGSIRWVPMTTLGANGHIQWQIDKALVDYMRHQHGPRPTEPVWMSLAFERPGTVGSLDNNVSTLQWDILQWLATMQV